jgi:hypothetical protein
LIIPNGYQPSHAPSAFLVTAGAASALQDDAKSGLRGAYARLREVLRRHFAVTVRDSRGVQVGDHNIQFNRFGP